MSLDRVLTMPEVAGLAGWQRRRMVRHLLRLNAELGGMLLHNVGTKKRPRWTITLKALRSVAPQWFTDAESHEGRIAALEEIVARQERMIQLASSSLARLAEAS